MMASLRGLLHREQSYEPLEGDSYETLEDTSESREDRVLAAPEQQSFSWVDYAVFFLLGIAMLWAWNMFLAAAPYFQRRLASRPGLVRSFQSAELSVSTVGNLGSMIVLTKLQARANFPKRIMASLVINMVVFTLLALSTVGFSQMPHGVYYAFVMLMVFTTSLATGMCQNGLFAYVAGFGREEYTQAIMAGQGVAGVLPCIAQIVSVLSVPDKESANNGSSKSAFAYFLTATTISAITLVAFLYLLSRDSSKVRMKGILAASPDETALLSSSQRKPITFARLRGSMFGFLARAVALTFAVTMVFLALTAQITSVRDPASSPRLFKPASFIPLAFLFWNVGDLLGRLLPAVPSLRLTSYPRVLLSLAGFRILLLPLYYFMAFPGSYRLFRSDALYLFGLQLLSGVSNGYLGSSCMMGFVEWVEVEEREAAGSFMSLSLVGGLTFGSIVSFLFTMV